MKRRANLEREIECDGRIITKNTAAIATPQRENAFFPDSAEYEINHALEFATATGNNSQIAFLSLQQKLGPLDWGHNGVNHPTHHRPSHEITLKVGDPRMRMLLQIQCFFSQFQFFIFWVIILTAHPSIRRHLYMALSSSNAFSFLQVTNFAQKGWDPLLFFAQIDELKPIHRWKQEIKFQRLTLKVVCNVLTVLEC